MPTGCGSAKLGPGGRDGHPLDPAGGPYLGVGGQFGSNRRYGPLAPSPPSATSVLFADGSVRPLIDSITPEVFEALATIRGGEEVRRVGEE